MTTALRLRWCVQWRLAGGIGVPTVVLHGGVAPSVRSPLYRVIYMVFTTTAYSWRAPVRSAEGDAWSGPGGDVRANAISRLATSSVGSNPRPGRCCGGGGATTGAGQSVQVRVKGRRQGNICGRDEVDLVTTAWGEPLVGTPTRGRQSSYGTHQPESQPAIFTGCATPVAGRPASPL